MFAILSHLLIIVRCYKLPVMPEPLGLSDFSKKIFIRGGFQLGIYTTSQDSNHDG